MGAYVVSSTNRWLDYPFTLARTDEIATSCQYCGRPPSSMTERVPCDGCGAPMTTRKVERVIDIYAEIEKRRRSREENEAKCATA